MTNTHDIFVVSHEPNANRWVLTRASDGVEIAEAKTVHGLFLQAEAYLATLLEAVV